MARRREPPAAPVTADRPPWLTRFVCRDWFDASDPLPPTAGVQGGSGPSPGEEAWLRRALLARGRWNVARAQWFREHGEAERYYRVRLTGRTPDDEDAG